MTATAVTSVSADPPSLLVCINNSASLHDPVSASGRFCVNVLRVGHENIATAFSGSLKGEDRYALGSWHNSSIGTPYLEGAQINFFCQTKQILQFGTHSIFIGVVENVLYDDTICPLLYEQGQFMRSARLEESAPAL